MERPQLVLRPSEVAENIFFLEDNSPFSLNDRDYLKPIYDSMDSEIILVFGRQCEKSTFICNMSILHMLANPGFTSLYVAPMRDHMVEFSRAKLDARLRYSPMIFKYFYKDGDTQNVFEKRLTNRSRIILRSALHDATTSRGISADMVACDEMQDMLNEHIPVIHECLSHSKHKIKLYAGTPKISGDALDSTWQRSRQTEWMMICPQGHFNAQGLDIIAEDGPRCMTCKSLIERSSGAWVSLHPERRIAGYRISQLMVPWVKWEEILEKFKTYDHARFLNEVLALPCDELDRPLTEADIKACCDPSLSMRTDTAGRYLTVAGIDWGTGSQSYTVLSILSIINDMPILIYAKRFTGVSADPEVQVREIIEICKRFHVKRIACDWGFGFVQNSQLRKALGEDMIVEVMSSVASGSLLKWDKNSTKLVVHRDYMLSRVFNAILQKQIKFPHWEAMKTFAQDILNISIEIKPNRNIIHYIHPDDRPDDFAHSLMYSFLCSELILGRLLIER